MNKVNYKRDESRKKIEILRFNFICLLTYKLTKGKRAKLIIQNLLNKYLDRKLFNKP